ncbi:hypothetical protein B0T11DRAFT_305855 [Plectosphaerella cucumerina]|uniref:DUF7082 domain-containing protein n=1 Tax=Plectosphaerella cucumerina TaxID=40658 RepID=A0A8K0X539_9PEZI|nr:hypothetical protein B0T11DRAFT_305855 [Plectosphaerella cucumerina]
MSASKFECAPYKPFEPDYHPQRPIIVGEEGLDSPETVTLKYEEAVARANGDLRGGSPPEGLLPMSQYGKPQPAPIQGYDAAREYQDAAYQHYGSQSYGAHQPGSAGPMSISQMNQDAFAANSAVGQYMPVGAIIATCQPQTGLPGSKVHVKASSPDDILTMASPPPYLYLAFGSHKVLAEDVKNSRDANGCCLTFLAAVPDAMLTNCPPTDVPLTLLLETSNGEEVSRTAAGHFSYHDGSLTGPGAGSDGITGKSIKGSPEQQHASPRSATTQLGYDTGTNTYDFNTAPQPTQQSFNGFAPDNSMLSTYRSASFSENHFSRGVPPPLRPPMAGGWQGYSRTAGSNMTQAGRPSLTPLPMPTPTTPTLVRTTSLQSSPGGNQGASYPGWGSSSVSNKATLNLVGKLESMAHDWSAEEWANKRRIVMFSKKQQGTTVTASFRPVGVNERPPHATCISCIWWAEKNEAYVSSVDTILLLENLVVAPNRFSVEEKNRIRRNLEGFKPKTVCKGKSETEEFFKVIMGFPAPKPRNIEKDVKVFPWSVLESALKKIIGKYSATTSSSIPASQLLTHQPPNAYPPPPTPPAPPSVASDPVHAYAVHSQVHHDNLASPRTMPSNSNNWSNYPVGPVRTLSPTSPRQNTARLGQSVQLPGVSAYDSRPIAASSYGGHHAALQAPPPHHAPPRWDQTTMPSMQPPASYAESYQPMSTHHVPSHPQVYGSSGYGDGSQRG